MRRATHLPRRRHARWVRVEQLGLVPIKSNDEARDAVRPLAVALSELLLCLSDEPRHVLDRRRVFETKAVALALNPRRVDQRLGVSREPCEVCDSVQ
jgi:hypothetical protein